MNSLLTALKISETIIQGLTGTTSVLVEGNKIVKLGSGIQPPDKTTTFFEGGGRTLMPGLIDTHVHRAMASIPISMLLAADAGYGTDLSIRLAIRHNVKIAWGTDSLFDATHAASLMETLSKISALSSIQIEISW